MTDFSVDDVSASNIPHVKEELDDIKKKVHNYRDGVEDLKEEFSGVISQQHIAELDKLSSELITEWKNHRESVRAKALEFSQPQMTEYERRCLEIKEEMIKEQKEAAARAVAAVADRKKEGLIKAKVLHEGVKDRVSQFLLDTMVSDEFQSWKHADDNDIRKAMNSKGEWKVTMDQVLQGFQEYCVLISTHAPDDLDKPESSYSMLKEQVELAQKNYEEAVLDIETEDASRNIYTLDKEVTSKLDYPKFSGKPSECFVKFQEKFERALKSNKVPKIDQADKLRENLSGDALRHIPDTVKDINTAFETLNDLYGDPYRITDHRLKELKKLGKFPSK